MIAPRIRTGFSFRRAFGKPDEIMSRLKSLGVEHFGLSDTTAFGFAPVTKAAKKAGIRISLGVEIAVSPDKSADKPVYDHWTFLPFDDLRPINELINLSTLQFRYLPLLSYEQAMNFAEKHGHIITGSRPLIGEGNPISWDDLKRVNASIPLSPSTPIFLVRQAIENEAPLIACGDNFYPAPEDGSAWQTLAGLNAYTQATAQHIVGDGEWREAVAHHGLTAPRLDAARTRGGLVLSACDAPIRAARLPVPVKPAPLRTMCEEGAARLGVNLGDPVYAARLDRELSVIKEKDFEDYFYIVANLCHWARNVRKIAVGPARGSSCGSLVCYLLGITAVDPIPFGLIFERFIDVNRSDNPDIDIDFSYIRRDEVFEYLSGHDQYKSGHVARLGTVNYFQAKSALDTAGKSLRVPPWEIEKIKENLVERPAGDPRELLTVKDTFDENLIVRPILEKYPGLRIAERLEGHPSHAGQHAAAVVISREPIIDTVAIDFRLEDTGSAVGTTQCDKDDAEGAFGLLKIDALGLVELSVFESALKLIGKEWGFLETLPLDDPKVFDVLNRHSFNGVFQWGAAVQQLSRQIKIDSFNDLVSLNALARPGPLKSGSAQEWIERRNGKAVSYPHPVFEPILKETLGVITYQEQVMRIAREVGDMTWPRVTEMRRAIGKSKGRAALAEFETEFLAGCRTNGVPDHVALRVWLEMVEHGAYSFNKSHAVAYAMIAYWGCWLKAYHPFEFGAANLTHRDKAKNQLPMLRELKNLGMDYIPVHAEKSHPTEWSVMDTPEGRKLLGPISGIIGIGPKLVSEVISHRANVGAKLSAGLQKKLANPRTPIDSLNPISEKIAKLHPDPLAVGLRSKPMAIASITDEMDGPVVVWCKVTRITKTDENSEVAVERRGYRHKEGPLVGLSMIIEDDTGEIFAKVGRFNFDRIGKPILEHGRAGNALYAFSGTTFPGAKIVMIEKAKYLGDMGDVAPPALPVEQPEGEHLDTGGGPELG